MLILGLTGLWIAVSYTPESPPPGLKCVVKSLTGFECPGCGITRGMTALAHGRIREAHVNFPFILPVFFGLLIALVGAVLPDRIWCQLMAKTWIPGIICLCGGLTALGLIVHWLYRLIL